MAISVSFPLYLSTTGMVLAAVMSFLGLSFFAAPYGKYSTAKGFGPMMPAQIAWAVMECPNLVVSALVWYYRDRFSGNAHKGVVNRVALGCFLLHYFNRSIVYPLRMSSSKTTPMPLSVMLAAFAFCSWNGSNQALALIVEGNSILEQSSLADARCILGLIVFFFGLYVNITSDNALINAKKAAESKSHKAGTDLSNKYVIPRGGMFEYVSCANYCKPSIFSTIYLSCIS